jgi:hypothetical protein
MTKDGQKILIPQESYEKLSLKQIEISHDKSEEKLVTPTGQRVKLIRKKIKISKDGCSTARTDFTSFNDI